MRVHMAKKIPENERGRLKRLNDARLDRLEGRKERSFQRTREKTEDRG